MNFPVWDLGFAPGLLIAIVAVLHVFVSHFAVGGGLFLVLTEARARRRGDQPLLAYVRRHARFFLLLTLVFGALSGVGIWFAIGLVNPAGTSSLIRAFVWGWAIEWVFFLVEIVAALVYYYGWERFTPRKHLLVGWIYFLAAWLSMVVINGILAFQMTPGKWLQSHDFWDGYLNPTMLPTLATRTAFALGLAGLFALVTGSLARDPEFKRRLVRYAGWWTLIPMAASAAFFLWWWRVVPAEITALVAGDMPIATAIYGWMPALAAVVAGLLVVGPILLPRLVSFSWAMLATLAALALMGGAEWVRESVRKPWVIVGYMYSNGIRADELEEVAERGYLASARWARPAQGLSPEELGEQVYRVACMSCHSRTGYLGLAQRVADWDRDFAKGMVQRIGYLRAPMPPWAGTEEEADALAAWLMTLKGPPPDPLAGGERVFEARCAACHTIDGERALRPAIEGASREELDELLQDLETDEMPAFGGTEQERGELAAWLARIAAQSEGGAR